MYLKQTLLLHVHIYDLQYCKLGNFPDNFIFVNSVKRHICDVQNSRLEYDLPISVNNRVISHFVMVLFSRNFAHAKFREN